jgi:hypothetical protein
MQQNSEKLFLNKRGAVFSAWSLHSDYKKSLIELSQVESSFEMPALRDMNLGAEELN